MSHSFKPLSGITVVDLSRLLPGPFCSLILADLGARVFKVEDPAFPDYLKTLPLFFSALNRGKKIVSLSLTNRKDFPGLQRLIKKADVLIETFRPGVLERLGWPVKKLHKINPRLVIASISGFGQIGPNRDRAGHDLNYMSMAGCLNPPEEGIFPPPTIQYADLVGGGLFAALSIITALGSPHKKGIHLDICMTDVMAFLGLGPLTMAQASQWPPIPNLLWGGVARYNIYQTADGHFISLGALEDKFWRRFCDLVGLSQNDEDQEKLKKIFSQRTREEWIKLGSEHDICLTPVLSPQEVFESTQFKKRKFYVKKRIGGKTISFPKLPLRTL